jgi:hypothetical protein
VESLHTFVMDKLSRRREVIGFRTSIIYQHSRKPVTEPLPAP